MYMDSDDARSDFLLAAIVYLIGGAVLGFLFSLVGRFLPNSQVVAVLLSALIPFLLLWAMPLYLMRYRGEAPGALIGGSARAVPVALALGAVIVAGNLGGDLLAGNDLVEGVTGVWASPANVVGRLVEWTGVAVLVSFLYRRGEYAFRTIDDDAGELHQRAALATAGVAVLASILLLLAGRRLGIVAAPLGVAAAYVVAVQMIGPRGVADRWQVVAPLIALALGPVGLFGIFGDSANFMSDLRTGGMLAGVGLLSMMGLRAGLGTRMPLVLGVLMALLTSIPVFGSSL